MFKVDPNTIYYADDLAEITGFSKQVIYEWFKDGLKHLGQTRKKAATGRAILEYFERDCVIGQEYIPDKQDIRLEGRLRKAGIGRL